MLSLWWTIADCDSASCVLLEPFWHANWRVVGFEKAGCVLQKDEEVFVYDNFDAFESAWIDWIASECVGYILRVLVEDDRWIVNGGLDGGITERRHSGSKKLRNAFALDSFVTN